MILRQLLNFAIHAAGGVVLGGLAALAASAMASCATRKGAGHAPPSAPDFDRPPPQPEAR